MLDDFVDAVLALRDELVAAAALLPLVVLLVLVVCGVVTL